MKLLKLFWVFIFALPCSFAQQLQSQTAVGSDALSGIFLGGARTNLMEPTSVDSEQVLEGTLMVDVKAGRRGQRLRLVMTGSQDFHDDRESRFGDGSIGFMRVTPIKGVSGLIYIHDYRLTLPISENSQKNTDLQTGIAFRPLFILGLEQMIGLKRSTLILSPRITKNFHRADVARDGSSNSEWVTTLLGVFNYAISDKWSINLTPIYSKARTYQGNSQQDQFYFSQDITYQVSQKLALSLGHSNAGTIYAANGIDNNVNFFDQRTSNIFLSAFYMF